MTETKATCETCRFWRRNSTPNIMAGHCRRYPPFSPVGWRVYANRWSGVPFEVEIDSAKWLNDAWPNTSADAWCGEHSTREQEQQR